MQMCTHFLHHIHPSPTLLTAPRLLLVPTSRSSILAFYFFSFIYTMFRASFSF
jgi:hypothetical protein